MNMSKRRDWDKVHAEDKVHRKGALPVTEQKWQSEMEMQPDYKGSATYDDLKAVLTMTLKHLVFTYKTRRCRAKSDLTSFLQLNQITQATPEVQTEFAKIQTLVNEDFDRLIKSIAISNPHAVVNGTVNFQREFIKLLRTARGQQKPLNSMLELL